MEEILASIRRIISEDDPPPGGADDAASAEPAATSAPDAAAPDAAPTAEATPAPPSPTPVEPEDDEVLELTDRVEPEDPPVSDSDVESLGDLDVFPAAAAAPPRTPPPEPSYSPPAPSYAEPDDSLLSNPAASASASAFAALTQSIAMPKDGRQLEDVVRELLRPLIKQWLDDHLPRIVENAVQTEVERIARRHG